MSLYYICPRKTWHDFVVATTIESNYLPLAGDMILVKFRFPNERTCLRWEETPGVIILPHPLLEPMQPLDPAHVKLLAPIGVTDGDVMISVPRLARERDKLMGMRVV